MSRVVCVPAYARAAARVFAKSSVQSATRSPAWNISSVTGSDVSGATRRRSTVSGVSVSVSARDGFVIQPLERSTRFTSIRICCGTRAG
jgi:hypothetical protein